MLIKIIKYFRGYLCIRVTGQSTERFLNACSHRGIYIWGLRPVKNAYEMYISIKDFHNLKPVLKKTGTKVVIIRREGFPFFLQKYRKQKMLFTGAILALFVLFSLSCVVWDIHITGNQRYTDETLLEFLTEKEVYNGMLKKDIDCDRIVKDIRKEYNDIIWVSASIQGTRLMIQIKENEDSVSVNEKAEVVEKAYDIVADESCIITELVIRKGIAQVKEGDEIKAGDILVSGLVPVKNDAGEVIEYQKQISDADITGKSVITYQNSIQNTYNDKKDLSIIKKEYYMVLGKYRISFGGIKNEYENFEESSTQIHFRLTKHFYLPFYIGQRSVIPYENIEKTYSDVQIRKILTKAFLYDCEDLEKKGVEILQNDVKIYRGSLSSEAKGTLTVEKSVGMAKASKEIEISNQQENEQSGELIDGNDGNSH